MAIEWVILSGSVDRFGWGRQAEGEVPLHLVRGGAHRLRDAFLVVSQ